jgi:tetratricopeptide (TPR) repeat protein
VLLIEESKRRRPHDAAEAYHLAELARTVAYHSPKVLGVFDLIALATAHMANARRAAGQLREAEEHFTVVRHLVRHEGVVDTQVLAEFDHLEGSLRKDQRQFALAQELLDRAAMLYRVSENKTGVGRVLLTRANLYFDQGRLDRAIETARSALRRFRRRSEPFLYLCGRHSLALFLAKAGRHDEAAVLVAADQDLYQQFADPWTQLRLVWLKGTIATARGEYLEAEKAFLAAREGFAEQGIGYDVAMVSLDLAFLYLEQRRTAELKRLSEEMVTIFAAQDVHREAAAALVLFQDAVRQEALTVEMVGELAHYLRQARTDPSLRFREPS